MLGGNGMTRNLNNIWFCSYQDTPEGVRMAEHKGKTVRLYNSEPIRRMSKHPNHSFQWNVA